MPKKKPQDRFARLRQLRCFGRVNDMLCFGYPAPDVAKFVKSQGEYRTATMKSLAETLRRYRRTELLPADVLACRRPDILVNAKKAYTDKLGELRQLDLLFQRTLCRYDRESAKELDSGRYNPAVDKLEKSMMGILKTIHSIKMDLGIAGQRQMGTLTISPERLEEIRNKHGDGPARVMADPVSRARILAYIRAVNDAAMLKAKEDDRAKVLMDRVARAQPEGA